MELLTRFQAARGRPEKTLRIEVLGIDNDLIILADVHGDIVAAAILLRTLDNTVAMLVDAESEASLRRPTVLRDKFLYVVVGYKHAKGATRYRIATAARPPHNRPRS